MPHASSFQCLFASAVISASALVVAPAGADIVMDMPAEPHYAATATTSADEPELGDLALRRFIDARRGPRNSYFALGGNPWIRNYSVWPGGWGWGSGWPGWGWGWGGSWGWRGWGSWGGVWFR